MVQCSVPKMKGGIYILFIEFDGLIWTLASMAWDMWYISWIFYFFVFKFNLEHLQFVTSTFNLIISNLAIHVRIMTRQVVIDRNFSFNNLYKCLEPHEFQMNYMLSVISRKWIILNLKWTSSPSSKLKWYDFARFHISDKLLI